MAPLADPKWVKDAKGRFHRLAFLDVDEAGLRGVGGVFLAWNRGIRPAWLYVGHADDLGVALDSLAGNADVMDYEVNGGVFVTWSLIRGEYQDGVVRYLTEGLRPKVVNPRAPGPSVKPIPVMVPGT